MFCEGVGDFYVGVNVFCEGVEDFYVGVNVFYAFVDTSLFDIVKDL